MSWLFSRALVEAFSEDISLDGEQSVQSSGNSTQQAYCAPDKMTGFSRLSRYGMTYKPLTDTLGEELLKSYLGAFLVRTLALPERELVSQESDQVCGNTWHALLARYDQSTHSWKTAQCSLFEDLELSLETFPKWGMTVGGELYLQPTLVQDTNETEYGSWATPTTMDTLPPKSEKALMREATVVRPGRRKPANLRDQVSNMQYWPTPKCSDSRHAISRHITDPDGFWKSNLGEVVMSMETPSNGRLNPQWVAWLMGWPVGWTSLKPLEMDKSPSVLQPHGNYLHKETNDSLLD